jgi:hypothetical protein
MQSNNYIPMESRSSVCFLIGTREFAAMAPDAAAYSRVKTT